MIHAYWAAFIGGLFIGLAAIILWAFNGRIMGISGIVGSLLSHGTRGDRSWRLAFIAGLLLGAFGLYHYSATSAWFETDLHIPIPALIAAGLLVGFGTRLGSGCTSGHGICGLSRFSKRSAMATGVFMIIGVATVTLLRNFFGIW